MTGKVPTRGYSPSSLTMLVELVALSGFALGKPVLDVFADGAQIFVAQRAGTLDVLAFAAIVTFGPALLLWVVELASGLVHAGLRRWVHLLVLGVLVGLVAVQIGKRLTDLGRWRLLVVAAGAGVAAAALIARSGWLRSWVRLLAAAPVVFAGLFLFASPVADVAFGGGSGGGDGGDGEPGRERVRVERPAPVVMIVLDELPTASLLDRTGHIDRELFPNFAALAGEATWYRNHTTVATVTNDAIPAILTGRLPEERNAVPNAGNHPQNLFTLLGGTYAMNVHESATDLCPSSLCGADAGRPGASPLRSLLEEAGGIAADVVSPKRSSSSLDIDAAATPDGDVGRRDHFLKFTNDLAADDEPRLDFVHSLLPHGVWNFLPSGAHYEGPHPPDGNFYFTWSGDFAAAAGRQRHLLQLRYTDALLGQALDRLRDLGTYDDSLVVVTADHGVSFRGGGTLRSATPATYTDIMWAPLFVKTSNQAAGEIDETPVRSIDVLPMIADHLGVEVPWKIDGRWPREPTPNAVPQLEIFPGPSAKDAAYLTFDGVEGYRRLLAEVADSEPASGPLGLYRFGRFGDLVGKRTRDLTVGSGSGLRGDVDDAAAFDDVDVGASDLPVYVTGTVRSDVPIDLAIAVNGIVGGWCDTRAAAPQDGEGTEEYPFWAVVPSTLLGSGRNVVEVFEIDGEPALPTLAPVELDT